MTPPLLALILAGLVGAAVTVERLLDRGDRRRCEWALVTGDDEDGA